VNIDEEKVNLYFSSKCRKDKIPIRIYGSLQTLQANKKTSFYRKYKKKTIYDTKGIY